MNGKFQAVSAAHNAVVVIDSETGRVVNFFNPADPSLLTTDERKRLIAEMNESLRRPDEPQ